MGDHASVGEELLDEVPELERKCTIVRKAVSEGYFTLEEALVNYKVSKVEYEEYELSTRATGKETETGLS